MLVQSAGIAMLMAVALPAASAKASQQHGSVQPDFGFCVPTIKFEGGLGGRPKNEFTFLPVDPVVAQNQQEALDPNIITNRICDQLATACEANDAALALCNDAQAQIEALGTRDQSTADTWNDLISGGAAQEDTPELKKRSEKRPAKRQIQFIPCSTDAWLDNCTGWPRKRDEPVEQVADVVKRSEPVAGEIVKRQIPFVPCSADAWIDTCTGWP